MAVSPLPPDIPYKYCGLWANKYWKNIPGPLYSTTTNMLSLLAFGDDQDHVMFDEDCEFIWRQPESPQEFKICLRAIYVDEVGSYQIDGNDHWTPELVRSWWRRRDELLAWAKANVRPGEGDAAGHWKHYPEAASRRQTEQYIRYLESDAEKYLMEYIFLLENGRPPTTNDKLPPIFWRRDA